MKKLIYLLRFFCCITVCFTSFQLHAQLKFYAQAAKKEVTISEKLDQKFKEYDLVILPIADIYQELKANSQSVLLDLQIGDKHFSLHLSEVQLYNDNVRKLIRQDYWAKGIEMSIPISFEGYSQNDPSNLVSITISEDYLAGMFIIGQREYYLEPSGLLTGNEKNMAEHLIFYEVGALKTNNSLETPQFNNTWKEKIEDAAKSNNRMSDYCIRLSLSADLEYYNTYLGNTLTQMLTIVNYMRTYYRWLDLDIETINTEIITPGQPNPFSAENYYSDNLITRLEEYYALFYSNVDIDAYHLFSGKRLDHNGRSSGRGHVCILREESGVLALAKDNNSGSFFVNPEQAMIHSRELGHLLGAQKLPGSSIMSPDTPFGGTTAEFAEFSKNQIRTYISSSANCIFCAGSTGGGCFVFPEEDAEKRMTKQQIAIFASEEIRYHALDAQKAYINHQSEIENILNSNKPKYKAVRLAFDELKKAILPFVVRGFLYNSPQEVSSQQIDLMNNFLSALEAVSTSQKLKSAIINAQRYLPVMEGKDLQSAIIAFDRANEEDIFVEIRAEETPLQQDYYLMGTAQNISTLYFEVATHGHMVITLYNLQGQKMETLLSEKIQSGPHQLDISKTGLSSGIYWVHSYFIGENHPITNVQRMIVSH